MTPVSPTSQRSRIQWTLFAATGLALLQISIYVPSMPGIAQYFGVPIGAIQLTVTVYAIGYAVGNLLWGPVSDRYGRRPALVSGSVICLVASAFCVVAPDLNSLFLGRAAQAVGASSIVVVGRAMIRDVFDRLGTARAMSLLATSSNVVPVLAPLLGGYLEIWFGWRASFIVIAGFAVFITAIVWWTLPETHFDRRSDANLLHSMMSGYARLLREPRFIGYGLTNMNGGISFYAFLSLAPAIIITVGGVSPDHFAYYSAMMPGGFMLGTYLNSRLVTRFGIERLLLVGGVLGLASGLVLIVSAPGGSPLAIVVPLLLAGMGNGFVMPNGSAGAVSVIPSLAGAAAGLSSFCQMIVAALATGTLSTVPIHSAMPLAIAFTLAGAVVFVGLAFCHFGRQPAVAA